MNASLLKRQLDDLVKNLIASGKTPSKEFISILDDISSDLIDIKENKKEKHQEDIKNKLNELIDVTIKNQDINKNIISDLVAAIKDIRIDVQAQDVIVPEIKVPDIVVPEIKVPEIVIPEIKVPNVIVPEIKVPEVKVVAQPVEVSFPKEIDIKKPTWFSGLVDPIIGILKNINDTIASFGTQLPKKPTQPISVRLSDGEKFYRAISGGYGGGGMSQPSFETGDGNPVRAKLDDENNVLVSFGKRGLESGIPVLETPPTDATKNNGSIVLGYNAAGQLVSIQKVINSTTYTKLITGDSITDTTVDTTKTFGVWT